VKEQGVAGHHIALVVRAGQEVPHGLEVGGGQKIIGIHAADPFPRGVGQAQVAGRCRAGVFLLQQEDVAGKALHPASNHGRGLVGGAVVHKGRSGILNFHNLI
jgi:hypothetical protein